MADDSDTEELRKEIVEILKNADLNKMVMKNVIQQLETKLGRDLRSKKKEIGKLVMDYVNSMDSDEEDTKESEGEEEEEEDEEEKPKPRKAKAKPKQKRKKVENDDDEENEEEDDDSRDSDYGSKKKKKAADKKKKPAAKGKKGGGVTKRGKGSGYTRAYKLSPALAELMGAEALPRHEVVKRVWAIIKEKQLFDPNNRQFAICDKALFKVIGTQRFHTFGMMKYLKNHFLDD